MDRVSVDLDIIISSKDIYKAARLLREKGFRVIVYKPYTITLERKKKLHSRLIYTAFIRMDHISRW